MKKLSNTEAELKKSVTYKKVYNRTVVVYNGQTWDKDKIEIFQKSFFFLYFLKKYLKCFCGFFFFYNYVL